MSAPTPKVRALVLRRDDARCVVCGTTRWLEMQHRQASGMGGRLRRPRPDELVTACERHNEEFEHSLQRRALLCGWKVRRWVGDPVLVPVWFPLERSWSVLDVVGGRVATTVAGARRMMAAVYGDDWEAVA